MGKFDKVIDLLNKCEVALAPGGTKNVTLVFQGQMPVTKMICPPKLVIPDDSTGQIAYTFDALRLQKKIVKELRKIGINVRKEKAKPALILPNAPKDAVDGQPVSDI